MIQNEDGFIRFYCDTCENEEDTGETKFYEAKEVAKKNGWYFTRRNKEQEYNHFCCLECLRKS